MPSEDRRRVESLELFYRQLRTTMWVVGIESMSSTEQPVLSTAGSPLQSLIFYFLFFFKVFWVKVLHRVDWLELLNSWFSCFHLPSGAGADMDYNIRLSRCILISTNIHPCCTSSLTSTVSIHLIVWNSSWTLKTSLPFYGCSHFFHNHCSHGQA